MEKRYVTPIYRFANKVHNPLLSTFVDVEIAGICAMNEKRLIKTAQKYNIPETNVFVSKSRDGYQEILNSLKPDGVYANGNWASGRRVFRIQMHAPGMCTDVELEKEAFLYKQRNNLLSVQGYHENNGNLSVNTGTGFDSDNQSNIVKQNPKQS